MGLPIMIETRVQFSETPRARPRKMFTVFENGQSSLGFQLSLEFAELIDNELKCFIGRMNDVSLKSMVELRLEQIARDYLVGR